jgi:NAD+ kinase
VKTLLLVAKPKTAKAQALAKELRQRHPELEVLADPDLAAELGWTQTEPLEAIVQRTELVIVLGGDGTLIHAARALQGRAVPILGVNLGSLGFMTEIPVSDLFPALEDVLSGNFRVDSRMKLSCRLYRNGKVEFEDEVLNDVVINKGALARIADHEMTIDGQPVTTYKSDGVVVATPTGSTAYALSAGGPIVHPLVECMVIAPICPHALTQRPLVVPGAQTVAIRLASESADVYLTIDGQTGRALEGGDVLEVRRSANRVLLVRNPKKGYFAILRQKLHWGER